MVHVQDGARWAGVVVLYSTPTCHLSGPGVAILGPLPGRLAPAVFSPLATLSHLPTIQSSRRRIFHHLDIALSPRVRSPSPRRCIAPRTPRHRH